MKLLFLIALLVTIAGCSSTFNTSMGELTGDSPPKGQIEIDGVRYDAEQGSYCWTNRCVDMIGPVKMLEDHEPVKVSPDTEVTFVMDYQPQPNEVHASYTTHGDAFVEIDVQDHSFQAPAEPGLYYFHYGVWWKDAEQENVSHGDSFYYFLIEVT